jgi:hypothetical protein
VREVYRKRGRVVRREHGHLIRVDEAGEAVDDGETFSVAPLDASTRLPEINAEEVEKFARTIEAMIRPPLSLERLIVLRGDAEHDFDGVVWSETSRRVHLSIARPPIRAIVDLADFSLDLITRVIHALGRTTRQRPRPRHVRLAPNVGAALLPSLIGSEDLEQAPAPHDGKGRPIERRRVTKSHPPNWFRPSYRVRPVRAWFHLRAIRRGEVDRALPEAIALLAPIENRTIHVLCADGAAVTVDTSRIAAIAPEETWYPYAAGAFGAEIML